jgi:signal transduction histidine kinase
MRQFSTDVSHELRTPLTAIRGQLEVAMFTAQTPEQYREAIMNALEDVERLSRTVRALLLLSQAESGQLALQMQTLDLSQAVREILEQFEIAAEAGKLRLTSSLEPDALITADRVQMERLISNLVSNAIKYTPEGGLVHVAVRRDSTEVCLEVEDTGEGIPAEHLPHIFDRFYRVPKRESTPERGLGLGLSFVAWIVRAHHGRIEVDSSVGQGSRFRVWLPAAPPQPAVAAESALAAR